MCTNIALTQRWSIDTGRCFPRFTVFLVPLLIRHPKALNLWHLRTGYYSNCKHSKFLHPQFQNPQYPSIFLLFKSVLQDHQQVVCFKFLVCSGDISQNICSISSTYFFLILCQRSFCWLWSASWWTYKKKTEIVGCSICQFADVWEREQAFVSRSLCYPPVHLYCLSPSSFIINLKINRSTKLTRIRIENTEIDTKR